MNGIFLILVALLFDGVQVLLTLIVIGVVLNWIVSLWAAMTFFVWLKMLGISYWEGNGIRKLLTFISTIFVEMIPIISAIPAWTLFVVLIIIFEYMEKVPVLGQVAQLASMKTAVKKV